MKIAVTDACIFIDIIELQLTIPFFKLNLEIHTTLDVYNELYSSQQEELNRFRTNQKLFIHNLSPEEMELINADIYPKSLSVNDKTVLFLANKLKAIVISSDKAVRSFAKKQTIEYHGMLWIFDNLVQTNLLSKNTAIQKLRLLVTTNIIYQNSMELNKEINARIQRWES